MPMGSSDVMLDGRAAQGSFRSSGTRFGGARGKIRGKAVAVVLGILALVPEASGPCRGAARAGELQAVLQGCARFGSRVSTCAGSFRVEKEIAAPGESGPVQVYGR